MKTKCNKKLHEPRNLVVLGMILAKRGGTMKHRTSKRSKQKLIKEWNDT